MAMVFDDGEGFSGALRGHAECSYLDWHAAGSDHALMPLCFPEWHHLRIVMGSGSLWCLLSASVSSSLSMWRLGTLFFWQPMFHPRSISLKCSAPLQAVCAQGMQINLTLALAKPS